LHPSQDLDVTDSKTAANQHPHSDVTAVTDKNPKQRCGQTNGLPESEQERAALRERVALERLKREEAEEAEKRKRDRTLFADDPGYSGTASLDDLREHFGE
jgi:hypothetical protein